MDGRTVGVLGAGQLGRMFVEAASRLNVKVLLLDSGTVSPAKQINYQPHDPSSSTSISQHVDGSFSDPDKIIELAKRVDVLTVEIEHVDAMQLQRVLDQGLVKAVHPLPSTILVIQDKYEQKIHLQLHNIPVADFLPIDDSLAASVQTAAEHFGYPLMLKSRTQAYDGKGNYVVKSEGDISAAVQALGGGKRKLYAERWAPFVKEVAVMVVRSASGIVRSYPAVETIHKDNICHTVFAPLRHSDANVPEQARAIAEMAVATFGGAGIFGVEMFLMPDGALIINEIAPRPHNSGHYTIEACETSQYENHLRAILDLPLGSTALKVPSAAMLNLLGLADLEKDAEALKKTYLPAHVSLGIPGATTHLYGKAGCRKGRKMGHITIVGQSDAEVAQRLLPLQRSLDFATQAVESNRPLPSDAVARFSLSSTPGPATSKSAADFKHAHPLVGIIMGSDSDLPVMLPAAEILKKFNVPFELTIVSAHRTPDRMREYARSAPARGLRVVIAGAGGAAHLPGMVAAQTALPVIGVPVKGSTLDGVDSLHSIVQMPRGIPVATVAINNSTNAALLAIRILAASDPKYLAAMQQYMDDMENEVLVKVEKLSELGWDYLSRK
ncbi:putative phosphoribosyl-5-aminoimidazole carboxylase [Tilletiaria anomala UBC 951]|uniref:Phosphoribosylaminoimidazole carboxylase n=1 Tax=Tilletiaria anomala (strain ATCC 24038 / CBS 436.72 / UBC 951) TaxID=1037660 RepID=A0A066VYT1_TILAU|nr:putative phosphoribosyl-5-aminoimidazole carboxylase [Tilletiaria anomala UBC 951]KDN43969.1 putative phosphoribosyl-5-aminoimidazole carboxylase [Tilletiaria anomala UBC 951]